MTTVPAALPIHPLRVANVVAQIVFGLLAMTICLPSTRSSPAGCTALSMRN